MPKKALPRLMFVEDPNQQGGGGTSANSGKGGEHGGAENNGGKGEGEKTFTQADVERIIAGRLQKYADYDDLKAQVGKLETTQQQVDAIAKAFGAKEGETPEADKLAETVRGLQEQFVASQRQAQLLEVADEHGIPKEYRHLLTATEGEALKAQAESIAELVKGKAERDGAPPFQSNPGQGQTSGKPPTLAEQIAAATKEGDAEKVASLKTQQLLALREGK